VNSNGGEPTNHFLLLNKHELTEVKVPSGLVRTATTESNNACRVR